MSTVDGSGTVEYLTGLWTDSYSAMPGPDLNSDLQSCRRYFDPLLRGQTLRDRVASLPETHHSTPTTSFLIGEPVVVSLDTTHQLVGVEARLIIEVLSSTIPSTGYITIDAERALAITEAALRVYRDWAGQRLRQVIALQSGGGRETLQAKAVGLILALLVNRSTDETRAVQPEENAAVVRGAEKSVFDGAEAFAANIAERSERSESENRLKSGYAATEARRRLPDFRIDRARHRSARYYLIAGSETRVITQLAIELARRERLDSARIAVAFDALVEAYRAEAARSAWLGGIHERPAETAQLRRSLLEAFEARATRSSQLASRPHPSACTSEQNL